ncbi:ATP-binding protein [Dankookia sp. P2]|uniref:ATP-binding protein n=1 Tax=Dankookia sp. P2 TaxID=3423955 RepID=UPI003D6677B4
MPQGMTARLADRQGFVVARSAGPARRVGLRIPAATLDAMGTRPAGWMRTEADGGTPVVAAFAHSAVSGWVTLVSLPEATFAAPLRRSLWIACGAGGLLALLATALALGFAHRIAGPIGALTGVAAEGAGAPLATPVREVNLVAQVLAAAQAEGRRRATEREALLATLDCAQVMVRQPDGVITLWTAGMHRLFGWTRDQALGRSSHTLLCTRFPSPLAEIEARLLAEGEWRGELRHQRSDGAEVVVASHWALRRGPDGAALAVVEACNDITAWRQAEVQLRDTQAELFRVARINAMGAMAAALAHELNQPLTAAVNFAEAARRMLAGAPEAPPLPAARAAMAEAAGEVVRAGEILRSLRRFIGRGDTEQRPIALNPVLESATALALAGSPTLAVTLRLALAPGLPPVMADAVQLQQVVVNLVRNAVEAMSGAERRELLVASALDGEGIAVSIADTGPGLDLDLAGRLFVPFVSTKPDGLGFGLSISHSIVTAHDGRLEAKARPGGGTESRFTLPVLAEAPVEEAADVG